MATHQRQPQPEFVVAPQGSNGAADLRGIQLIEASEVLQDLHQGQEGLPVTVGPLLQQLLPFSDLQLQIFHTPAVLLQLFAISPAMGRMLLLLLLEIPHQPGLGQHLPSQVVLRGGHVVAPGHVGHG